MKKLVTASAVILGAMLSSALAADMPVKAPAAHTAFNWTGFYLFGGGGYGLWNADQHDILAGNPVPPTGKSSGHGWFGNLGGGFDWQFAPSLVAGIFADAQFGDIRGGIFRPFSLEFGTTSNNLSYAGGFRIGHLVTPNTLLYANAGYSHAEFKEAGFNLPLPPPLGVDEQHRDGWFVGGGIESALGSNPSGWFAKIEYRFADYGRENIAIVNAGGNMLSFAPAVQTISVSLVYRFK